MTDKVSAKSFLAEVVNRFTKSGNVKASTYLSKLLNMRYNGEGNIRDYTMKMSNLVSKLNALKMKLSKEFLLHFILIFAVELYDM